MKIIFRTLSVFVIIILALAVIGSGDSYEYQSKANFDQTNTASVRQAIDQISRTNDSDVANRQIQDSKTFKILAFGDVMLGRNVGRAIQSNLDPFKDLKESFNLSQYAVVSANLEGPITDAEKCQKKEIVFKFSQNALESLKNSGINFLNLSNNHSFDCLSKGVSDTKENLEKAGLKYSGGEYQADKNYHIYNIEDKKVAFVGLDQTIGDQKIENYYKIINELDSQSDLVIVNVHWGEEYRKNPTTKQIETGRKMIDAGADLILGHHPHIIEPIEIYKDRAIFYSLGNMTFDQIGKDENTGMGVEIDFGYDTGDTQSVIIHPFKIEGYSPVFMNEIESELYCRDLRKESGFEEVLTDRCQILIKK